MKQKLRNLSTLVRERSSVQITVWAPALPQFSAVLAALRKTLKRHGATNGARTRQSIREESGESVRVSFPPAPTAAAEIPALTGLRGLAALLVLACHLVLYGGVPDNPLAGGGTVGVMQFFALSGFLMAHLYLHRPASPAAVAGFLRARLARVYPLYAVVLLAAGGLSIYPLDWAAVGRHLALIEGGRIFWTVAVEIRFYLAFAAAWALLRWRDRNRRDWAQGQGAPDGAVAALAYLGLLALDEPGGRLSLARYGPCFLAGLLAALLARRLPCRAPGIATAALAGLAGAVAARWWWGDPEAFYRAPPAHLAVALLLWAAATAREGLAVRWLSSAPMRAAGAWSYGIYLLHLPAIAAAARLAEALGIAPGWTAPAAVALTVALAAAAHRWIEVPARRAIRGGRRAVNT